jgi:serine/threonine-protein kinase
MLLHPIGFGGMATVYKAVKRSEICALKLPRFSSNEHESRERFLREAEIGRTLHHPNIVRILERGEVGDAPYFTMELIEGQTLSALLRLQDPLAPQAGGRMIAQVAEALDYAHLKGVIHRDLKPSNIMIARDGMAKVMDYGIARAHRFPGLTLTGAFLGTPEYTAPESAEEGIVDARSDLYSLGVVFYEALTGRRPFVGKTPFATMRKHRREPPTPPSAIRAEIPRDLEAIILRLLSKDPSERFQSAEELLIALRDSLKRAAQ